MTKLYMLRHQFGESYGYISFKKKKDVLSEPIYTDRENAYIFSDLDEVEKFVDKHNLEVELKTFLIGKNV